MTTRNKPRLIGNQKANQSKERLTRSKSPLNKVKSTSFSKVSQIPNIQSYSAMEKLKLTKETLEKIKQTLEIEHTSELLLQQRIKTDNYYIMYNVNPFTHIKPQPNKMRRKSITIIQSVNRLKEKHDYKNIMNRIQKDEQNAKIIHKQMKDKEIMEKKVIKKKNDAKIALYDKENYGVVEKKIDHFDDFERILKIKQQSYYHKMNQDKSYNIFKIIKDTDCDLYVNYNSLKKVYFCEDAVIVKPNSLKITNILQDISSISRMFVSGRHHLVSKDYRTSASDIKAILEEIKFIDLIMISSGMIMPENLDSYLYQQGKTGKDEDSSSLSEDKGVVYFNNQHNRHTNFKIDRHDKAEIQSYINHSYSMIEVKQERLSQMHKEKMIKLLKQEELCAATNVQDRPLLQKLNEKKKEVLVQQLDDQIHQHKGSIDKIIRLNKIHKDKVEKIKNNKVLETIKVQKEFQKRIKSKSKFSHHSSLADWR